MPVMTQTLKPDEISRVAFIYSRGGRFAPDISGRVDNRVGNAGENRSKSGMRTSPRTVMLITGERYSGCRHSILHLSMDVRSSCSRNKGGPLK